MMRLEHLGVVVVAAALMLGVVSSAAAADGDATAEAIRAEVLRPNRGPEGRPLPLAAHWHRNSMPLAWQIEQIREGHHLLPWIAYHRNHDAERARELTPEIDQLAAWRLPFALLTGGQWEADFYSDDAWKQRPVEETGVGVSVNGNRINAVSPFSPVQPWKELGRTWTQTPFLDILQQRYSAPPRVFFISNNEAHDIRWHKAEQLQRYLDAYGEGRDDNFKRQVFGDGWIERYSALIGGMRDGLSDGDWRESSRFIAYNAFGPDHFGRWGGWPEYSLHTEERVAWDWHAWEGGIPEAYDNHWEPGKRAYNVWSMQTEMMNLVFMQDEAFEANPDFWHEVIFWDGYLPGQDNNKREQYAEAGVEYTPQLYRGWVQYVMWTLTPRVAREWRASSFDRENWQEYVDEIVAAVDLVHADDVLAKFWRRGELVPNQSQEHPFQTDVPEKWRNVDRWFHLSTNLDPETWELDQRVPVYTLARVIGEEGSREWLVYAHAPMGERQGVEITIPSYRAITVDVPIEGAFYHVTERDDAVVKVGRP